MSAKGTPRPGSDGEHLLQDLYGTGDRADRFYREQMLAELVRMLAVPSQTVPEAFKEP